MKFVGLGGGHGLAATLRAARLYADSISAVVTVADDGGSSGRLTRELGIPPPGDIRNCLVALARDVQLADVFQHRFHSGALTGHTVGNLVIAALTEMHGDFAAAVGAAARRLNTAGHVFPATTELVLLGARVAGGLIKGQEAVARTPAPIQAVYLDPPDPPACDDAVRAIESADQIVLGPGSLFTSLIATLLVPGIRNAVNESDAKRIFICNSRMQKGETDGLDASHHVGAVLAHVGPRSVDAVVVQTPVFGADGVSVDKDGLDFLNVDVIEANVVAADGTHDPKGLAEVLRELDK